MNLFQGPVDANLLGILIAIVLTTMAVCVLEYREHCRRIDALKPYRPGPVKAKAPDER